MKGIGTTDRLIVYHTIARHYFIMLSKLHALSLFYTMLTVIVNEREHDLLQRRSKQKLCQTQHVIYGQFN